MKKIENNTFFQEKMMRNGYSKDRFARFSKYTNDAKLSLSFGYTTKGTCYLNFFIVFPKVEMIIKEIGDFQVPQIGGNTGYLLADKKFKEWSVDVIDERTNTPLVLDDILKTTEQYVFPILNRYSEIKSLLLDYENGLLPKVFRIEERLLPVLYFVAGEKKHSVELLDIIIDKYSIMDDGINLSYQENNRKEVLSIEKMVSSQYIDFATKMKAYVLGTS